MVFDCSDIMINLSSLIIFVCLWSLIVQVQCLEDERIQQEEILTQFKGLLNNQKDANRNLSKELDETKALEVQLTE